MFGTIYEWGCLPKERGVCCPDLEAKLVGAYPVHQRVVGSVPGQGTYLGYGSTI